MIALRVRLDRDPRARSELWLLLNTALQQCIRAESRRTGAIDTDELLDLASEKSLELMNQVDSNRWRPQEDPPERVRAFVWRVGRNGLVDYLRRERRRATMPVADAEAHAGPASQSDAPDAELERSEFVEALVQCVGDLRARERAAWLFRVFLEMTSREIAVHPEVDAKPSHVDVILQRCRTRVRDCMRGKGYRPADIPRGAFVALWASFRIPPAQPTESTYE